MASSHNRKLCMREVMPNMRCAMLQGVLTRGLIVHVAVHSIVQPLHHRHAGDAGRGGSIAVLHRLC